LRFGKAHLFKQGIYHETTIYCLRFTHLEIIEPPYTIMMNLQDLKTRNPAELLAFAEELDIENCGNMRKQDKVRRFGLRTGDTIEGGIRAPKDNERYFALLKVDSINGELPEKVKHRINFDNLTPLYPERKIKMEMEDPTNKGNTQRIIELVSPIGFGQRALIVAPPRTGKTVMLQNVASSISKPSRTSCRNGDGEGKASC